MAKTGKHGAFVIDVAHDMAIRRMSKGIGDSIANLVSDMRSYGFVWVSINELSPDYIVPGLNGLGFRLKGTYCVFLNRLDDAQVGEHVSNAAIDNLTGNYEQGSRRETEIDPDSGEFGIYTYITLPDGREFKDCHIMWERIK